MRNKFNLTLNKKIIYTYVEKPVPARLRRYLDEIDSDMDQGISFGGVLVNKPTEFQKLQYIAMTLFHALDRHDLNLVEIMSAYLLSRKNELKEVYITQSNEIVNLKLL